ncbi:MAG: cysteine synthase family protein, partial [Anaeroplasmataceae bacterium]|nr:cysteine synthase family protein [Anaeroplasmataceae bacterium]
SVKDRVAKQMLLDAIESGQLRKGKIILEATSGNTGIGLAAFGTALGFKVGIIMPASMSEERKKVLRAYGAKLILTPAALGMKGALTVLNALSKRIPNAYIPNQFHNESNWRAHYNTTALELWKDMEENIDVVVAGIGTGGTIMGLARYLKIKNPSLLIIGVEPSSSPVLTKGKAGAHKIQGIGAGFIPPLLDQSLIDEILTIDDADAYKEIQNLAKEKGLFLGPSAGAAICAARILSQRKEYQEKRIAVICPDSLERYISLLN